MEKYKAKAKKGENIMATNWKMNEIIDVVKAGKKEDIQDLGRRFPITTMAIAAGDFEKILGALPDHITVRKIEAVLKGEDVEADDAEEKTVEKKSTRGREAKTKVEEPEDEDEDGDKNDYQSMSSNELYKLLSKRGLTKGKKFSKKADMIAALEADDAGDNDEDDAVDDPIALYKECKSKGLKVKARQSAEYYKKELAKLDDVDDDDDDWDDDEEEEKSVKKVAKKAAKAKKEPEPEEDDDEDDDWDI
jgi:hypothetical protein